MPSRRSTDNANEDCPCRPNCGLLCNTVTMEFRCRLGTPGGEIIEGVYIADTEARLRQEFDEKGLFVLSLRRRGLWLPTLAGGRAAAGSAGRSF